MKDADGDIEVAIGDRIQAVARLDQRRSMLPLKGVRSAATQRELENAFDAAAVEGKVEASPRNEVRIARAPFLLSQILSPAPPTGGHVGKTYTFRIISTGLRQVSRRFGANSSKRNSRRSLTRYAGRSWLARC